MGDIDEQLKGLHLSEEDVRDLREQINYFRKMHKPRCHLCKKPFVNAIDTVTHKKNLSLWCPACSCYKRKFIISIG